MAEDSTKWPVAGKHLLSLLESAKLSQREWAGQMYIDHSLIHRWVKGERCPTPDQLLKILLDLRRRSLISQPEEVFDWVTWWGYDRESLTKALKEAVAVDDSESATLVRWLEKWKPGPYVFPRLRLLRCRVPRDAVLVELRNLLLSERDYRVPEVKHIGLVGMAGVGKTTVAESLILDKEVCQYFRNGVLWADVGPEGDPRSHLIEWCHLLDLSTSSEKNLRELQDHLQNRLSDPSLRFLIILDNAWRFQDLEPLLVNGPQTRVLVLAREKGVISKIPLAVEVVTLGAMTKAEGLTVIQHHLSGQVYDEITQEKAEHLLELVEGLPLAIALAADVVNSRGWDYTLRCLKDESVRLGILEKDKAERQEHSVRLAFNVSYAAQSSDDQRLFRWLGVFPASGSFSPAGVACLLSEDNILGTEERLRVLTDRNLLNISEGVTRETARFRLHALLHNYARQCLKEAGEWDLARERYIASYLQWAKDWQKMLGTGDQNLAQEWWGELPNVTQALLHAEQLGQVDEAVLLVDRVAGLARTSGRLGLLDSWLERLERRSEEISGPALSLLLKRRVELAVTMRQWGRAVETGMKAVKSNAVDVVSKGYIALQMALAWQQLGNQDPAHAALRWAQQCAETHQDPYLRASCLLINGRLLLEQGEPLMALQAYREAESAYLTLERNQEDMAWLYSEMAEAYFDLEAFEDAYRVAKRSMERARALGWPPMILQTGEKLLILAGIQGNMQEARMVLEEIEQVASWAFDSEPIRSQKMGLVWRLRSLLEYEEGQYSQAAESARAALMHMQSGQMDDESLALIWKQLAEIQKAMKNYEQAIEAAERSKEQYKSAGLWEEAARMDAWAEKLRRQC